MTARAKESGPRRWWVLAYQLPTQPAYARVKVWRRLQAVGAASFKNSLYLMPATEQALEDFEWILREVQAAGGEGLILDARAVQGFSDEGIVALFDSVREEQYRDVADEIREYTRRFARKRERPTAEEAAAQHARFRARVATVEEIDFFQANGREQTHALLRALGPHTRSIDTPRDDKAMETETLTDLKGRTWVTRANVHVDRMASAWLIRRRIDADARFKFVSERQYRPATGEIRFDMYDAEYTHEGDHCTFEVLVEKLGSTDDALRAIAEIIHDLDLKDDKYGRKEVTGVKQLLAGIVANHASDDARLDRAADLFDDLYQAFARAL